MQFTNNTHGGIMRIRTIAFLLMAGIGVSQAQIPRLISYQGIYTDTLGLPKPDSTYSFTFNLYNTSSGGTALWTETKTIPVRKGLFFTNLGDVTPLSLPFDAPYWLGVQVGANPELSPRTQLTSSGYSLRAVKADTAAYAGGAVLSLPFTGSVSTTSPAFTITNTGIGQAARFRNTNPSSIFVPTVDIETDGLNNGLWSHIDTSANVASAILGTTKGNGYAVYGNADNASGSGKGVFGKASGSGSAVEGVNTGTGWAGRFQINNTSSTSEAVSVTTNGNGNGIYVGVTGTGNGIVSVAGNSSSAANAIYGVASGSGFAVYGLSAGTGGGVRGDVTSGSLPAIYGTAAGPGQAVQGTNTGTGSAGRFIVSNTNSSADAVSVQTNGTGSAIDARITSASSASPAVFGTTSGLGRAASFTLTNTSNGNAAIYASTLGTGSAAYFETANASNTSPALQVSTLGGTGIAGSFNGRVKVNVLEILGGSDLAEPFESAHDEVTEPGTVMVIDDENPGKLKPSSTPYDPKVAGIVSGAGGVKPGLMLKQEGTLEGKTNVAIAGRVYCKVDATSLPVEPGDLLTTSTLPGHAMKAADRDRANGAIIGKAMSRLDTGTGLVLVLVNLQ
jgi:hypothetical protein